MNDQTDPVTQSSDMAQTSSSSVEARRRLLKAGLGGSAVLMTIKGRSALACTTHTCTYGATTPSAFGSINLSPGHKDLPNVCLGKSPGYWKTHDPWPYPFRRTSQGTKYPATKFGAVFPGRTQLSNKTLYEVLNLGGGGEVAMARALVAALLNAAQGLTSSVLSVERVKGIWLEYVAKGFYEPTAGIKWYANSTSPATRDPDYNKGITGYLESTYD